ncbi:DUF5309 family protein [uncultured Victivallis sp.]|uniref:SU10 major capsid protein n=1 Tax=uncultured Victivallis sp. TaxID=354118 RepID=UPI0025CDF485|nr:DUF5309 family protein [uncultured Victivallis sp.]
MLYSYSFQNKKRDLSDILSTVIKDEPRFISNFKPVENATQQKHEWLEDQIAGRSVTASAVTEAGVVTPADSSFAGIKIGTLLVVRNDSALFRVTALDDATFTVTLVAANGSKKTMPEDGDVLNIVSTPVAEGSNPGDGDETGLTGACEYNCCQIFRKDIILSGTALAINVFGSADNQLNRQTAFALGELARDLNRVALFGRRVEATATTRGEAGGLYFFGTRSNSPAIDALTTKLDSTLVNDAAQAVMGAGGDPTQILCSPGQARVLSCEYKNQLQILRSDDRRGAYVAVVVNEINGRGMTIMADPDVPDTDVWVLDPAGFGLSSLNGRAITDTDATPKGFDGIKRMALGELTFVFRNAAQRICRISNLQSSSEALAAIKAGN